MLVDLMRNDVGTIAKPNQIWIERFDVETYAEVQHLVTRVQGPLKDGLDAFDAFQAVFPGGSITGCPRTVVCAAIDELEKQPRSFWTGSLGWFETKTNISSWNIMIRTAELRKDQSGWNARVTAGGGITIESNPKSEVAEAKWKANALLRSCGWMDDDRLSIPRGDLSVHSLPIEGDLKSTPVLNAIFTEEFKQNSVLLIDNLDSFTFNIAHMICGLGYDVNILNGRSSSTPSAKEIMQELNPSHIILGPGPGWPQDSPLTMEFATMALAGELPPTLGICLGHQAIGIAAGWPLIHSPSGPVHGTPVECRHNGEGLFSNLSEINMTRYNSLTLLSSDNRDDSSVIIDATDATKSLVLAIRSKTHPVFGVQFHPESVGSQSGTLILDAFLNYQAHG
jgi:anthranilate synthase/aminodeoxychorismate synthase-like glutamine amidotransferase